VILQGSIERFDVASVLQFLAQNGATGILELRDFEEHGCVYLVRGRLEGISLPLSDDRLGVHLVRAGALSEGQLTRVLMEEAAATTVGAMHKPLGQRLVEKGFIGEATIRQAMCRLTMARMFELAHWRTGVFTYDEPEIMPEFGIAIQGNVQEMLLQAQVRIDRGERPRKQTGVRQDDPCYQCAVTDCSPAVRTKYLKKDACLWRKMSAVPAVPSEPRRETHHLYAEVGSQHEPGLQGSWVQF